MDDSFSENNDRIGALIGRVAFLKFKMNLFFREENILEKAGILSD